MEGAHRRDTQNVYLTVKIPNTKSLEKKKHIIGAFIYAPCNPAQTMKENKKIMIPYVPTNVK